VQLPPGNYRRLKPLRLLDSTRHFLREPRAENPAEGSRPKYLSNLTTAAESAPGARKGFLELQAFRKLRAELPDYIQTPVTLAFFSGMRLGEISRLTWQQVDLKDRTLNLNPGETKNDEARIIPLNRETAQMLKMLPRSGICFRPATGTVSKELAERLCTCRAWEV
jgi:integrase